MSLPKADFGVHGFCYCKDVPSKEARVSHACQRWARRNNIFAFVKIVPSINDAQTNVKNDDRRRETHGLRVSRSAGISIVARAVYGKDARYKQGMTGRSMAARASWPRPPVYRTAYALVDGERGDLVERIVNSDQTVHTEPIARPRRQSAFPLAALARQ